ncbi:hypothetical protein SELMODRAFT_412661 [Selaginella moellendorffii]|uniref:Uncharacterized protein n=1 Tax=Selaginella moellendorffii TaxID=88036 RepID=D8RM80_SELML|nr:hypothetical protein SELMODRAFT_412661 [Selaginella moellendorffii]
MDGSWMDGKRTGAGAFNLSCQRCDSFCPPIQLLSIVVTRYRRPWFLGRDEAPSFNAIYYATAAVCTRRVGVPASHCTETLRQSQYESHIRCSTVQIETPCCWDPYTKRKMIDSLLASRWPRQPENKSSRTDTVASHFSAKKNRFFSCLLENGKALLGPS